MSLSAVMSFPDARAIAASRTVRMRVCRRWTDAKRGV